MIPMPVRIHKDINSGGIHFRQNGAGPAVNHQSHVVFHKHAIADGEAVLGKYHFNVITDLFNHNRCRS
jgi:hypothetical protein